MWRTRIVSAITAIGLAVVGLVSIYVAVRDASVSTSMGLGLIGVLTLAGSALTVVSIYLE